MSVYSDVCTVHVHICVPVLHALVHAAVLDTLLLHVGAASSQTLYCLLQMLLLQVQLLQLTPACTQLKIYLNSDYFKKHYCLIVTLWIKFVNEIQYIC